MTELELVHLIHHTGSIFRRAYSETSGETKRRPPGAGKILAVLSETDGITQTQLASMLHIRPQSLTSAVAHLEKEGYVERQRSENDKRELIVKLTESGREHGRVVEKLRSETAKELFSCLSEEELESIGTALNKVLENYDKLKGGTL